MASFAELQRIQTTNNSFACSNERNHRLVYKTRRHWVKIVRAVSGCFPGSALTPVAPDDQQRTWQLIVCTAPHISIIVDRVAYRTFWWLQLSLLPPGGRDWATHTLLYVSCYLHEPAKTGPPIMGRTLGIFWLYLEYLKFMTHPSLLWPLTS